MPNAEQYRAAAARFRVLGDQHLRQAALVGRWPVADQLGDGPVAAAARAGLDRAAARLVEASGGFAELAAACDRRAAVCEEYRRAVGAHARLDPSLRPLVPRPAPPFPWVSA